MSHNATLPNTQIIPDNDSVWSTQKKCKPSFPRVFTSDDYLYHHLPPHLGEERYGKHFRDDFLQNPSKPRNFSA